VIIAIYPLDRKRELSWL